MKNAMQPSGTATVDQYVSLAIAVTEVAFWDYCDCVCDLHCLRRPNRSEYTRKRNNSVKLRAMKAAHISASSTDVQAIVNAVAKEKNRLSGEVKRLERFFESGVCGNAFHFPEGNVNYFREEVARLIENYVRTGKFK